MKSMIKTAVLVVLLVMMATSASAHCDALDGPVIQDARQALERGDVTPVLKWIPAEDSGFLTEAFAKTLSAREQGEQARELADRWFFETLVRVHREGEGAHFTGLKPAGAEENPAVAKADAALRTGEIDTFADLIAEHTGDAVRKSYAQVVELAEHKDESPEAGRRWVEAYVHYIHLVKDVAGVVHGHGASHGTPQHGAPHGE